jgi:hypothetical protein
MKNIYKANRATKVVDVDYDIKGLVSAINEAGRMNHETMSVSMTILWNGKRDIYINGECQGRFSKMETLVFLRAFYLGWKMSDDSSRRWYQQQGGL